LRIRGRERMKERRKKVKKKKKKKRRRKNRRRKRRKNTRKKARIWFDGQLRTFLIFESFSFSKFGQIFRFSNSPLARDTKRTSWGQNTVFHE